MNIIFRVDSSSKIGIGHLMRCLALAEQYQNDNVIFAFKILNGHASQKIIDRGYKGVILNTNSPCELSKQIKLLQADLIVFDHYGIDYNFEKIIKDKTNIKILSFDDNYKQHHCDILLNHNIYADKYKYKGLVPESCEVRCGKKYTLIRREFKKITIRKRPIHTKKTIIFVSMGGTDHSNISLSILKVLSEFDNIEVNLALTNSNQNLKELQNFVKQLQYVNICIDFNIAEMMNSSDFAIITPSVILHEAMFLKLPFITIKTADNQELMYQYLLKNKYPAFRENELDILSKEIRKYVPLYN